MKAQVPTAARPIHNRTRVVSVLFFWSGATGLAYEVIWFKRFSYLWGNSALAMAVVVAAVLLCLGLGAFFMGRHVDRIADPIRWYAGCEAAVGLCALLIPFELRALAGLNGWLHSVFHSSGLLLAVARGALTLAVIGPACFCMGATLPLLVKHAALDPNAEGSSPSWFYGVNTAGGAAGCLLTGFWVIPTMGLFWTNLAVAAVNFIIAGVALRASTGEGRAAATQASAKAGPASARNEPVRKGESVSKPDSVRRTGLVLAAALLAGFASLGLQMIWNRQLAVMLGGTTYAFSATLFIFLIGVGAGSLLYPILRRRAVSPAQLGAWVIGVLIVATVAGKFAIPRATQLVALIKPFRESQLLNTLICAGAAATLELIPALCMGILFPHFVALAGADRAGIGRAIGSVYGWNTFGSIGGAFLTMLVLVPALTLPTTLAICLGLYAASLLLLSASAGGSFRPTFIALAVGIAGTGLVARPLDPRMTDFGSFMYGYVPEEDLREEIRVLSFHEGRSCNVLVTESKDGRWLRVNGKVDAGTRADMETQLALAYLPRALRPEAREVLIVGFGSGTTAGASLLFPETRVSCAEIEPGVLAASQFFSGVNHRPEASDRFTPILDDGRSLLQATAERFDLIISEPSNPWIAGISSLFSQEAYQAARSRLTPGGLFAEWIQLYALQASDYRMIVRTFRSVFPHAALIWINDKNTILVGSDRPILPQAAGLEGIQRIVESLPPVRADLEKYFQARSLPALLFSRLLLDDTGLRQLAEADHSTQLHTDLNLRLEFDAPRRLFGGAIDEDQSPARAVLKVARASLAIATLIGSAGPHPDLLVALKHQTSIFSRNGMDAAGAKFAKLGRSLAGQDPFFLSQILLLTPEPRDEAAFLETATQLAAVSAEEAGKVGAGLWQRREYAKARVVFEALVKQHPGSAAAWMNLAMNYRALGLTTQAEDVRRRALELDPLAGLLRSALTALDAQKQKNDSNTRESKRPPVAGEEHEKAE